MKRIYGVFCGAVILFSVIAISIGCASLRAVNNRALSPEYMFAWDFLDVFFLFRDNIPRDPFAFASPVELYESVNEPFTNYYTPNQASRILNSLGTSSAGLGVRLDSVQSGYALREVFPNTPAEKAGLKKGDTLTSINGKKTAGLSARKVSQLLSGKRGEQKELEIARANDEHFAITVAIDEFLAPSVFSDSLTPQIAYIFISSFFTQTAVPGGTAAEFKNALQETAWADQTILDLRDNPGGEIGQAVQVVSEFLEPQTPIVKATERTLNPNTAQGITVDTTWVSLENHSSAVNRTFFVLMNQATASASEFLIASFNAHRSDIISIGSRSYGKARGQAVVLTPDSGLSVVTFALITPIDGPSYDMTGIEPNIKIGSREDALDKALEIAESRLTKASLDSRSENNKVSLLRYMYSLQNRKPMAIREFNANGIFLQ
ncbi:MAG: PDZ domain-containing protein [Chitinispirillales bacterium]|jgi:carboxyl-terminal processing protease|nr:PDZ domain-containing protein [Chitinispirillales bacterium]